LAKDAVLRSLGLHPQRCYICRARFYSFNPNHFRSLIAALNGPSGAPRVKTAFPEETSFSDNHF
jgi:hypothetical protein